MVHGPHHEPKGSKSIRESPSVRHHVQPDAYQGAALHAALIERSREHQPTDASPLANADSATQARLLLGLQRTHGNTYVQRLVQSQPQRHMFARPRVTAIQRFGSGEHKQLGDAASGGAKMDLDIGDPKNPLSYGDIVALVGDYFESAAQLRSLAGTPDGAAQVRWARKTALGTGDPGSVTDSQKKAVSDRYYTLASHNFSHFSAGGSAHSEYASGHQRALGEAYLAGVTGGAASWSDAMLEEAGSNHFLTDMFSAGHVRTPRGPIKEWYEAHYGDSVDKVVAYIGAEIRRLLDSYGDIPWYFPNASVEASVQAAVREKGGAMLEGFSLGDIVSAAYHDQDSIGLNVVSDVDQTGKKVPGGFQWVAVGDDRLKEEPKDLPITRLMAEAAIKTSLDELARARFAGEQAGKGRCLTSEAVELGTRAMIKSLQPFGAEEYVPRENAAAGNAVMDWKWTSLDSKLHAQVDKVIKEKSGGVLASLAPEDKILNRRGHPDSDGAIHLHVARAWSDFCKKLSSIGIEALVEALRGDAAAGSIEEVDAGAAPPTPVGAEKQ